MECAVLLMTAWERAYWVSIPFEANCTVANERDNTQNKLRRQWTHYPHQLRKGGHSDALTVLPPHHEIQTERSLEVQQAEKEDRSSNEKKSRMIAERLEFQTFKLKFNNKQIQHCQPSSGRLPRKAMPR
eukprot:1142160-Pelagomonas_calceolata.AAC.3